MIQVSLVLLVLLTSTVLSQQKPKYDAASLEKALYKIGSIQELRQLGINTSNVLNKSPIGGRKTGGFQALKFDTEVDATPGKCDPKPVCIANPLNEKITDSNQVVYPACINIHRCDGCCPQDEKCVATKVDNVKMKNVGIIKIQLTDMIYEDGTVQVQNHTDCECRCQFQSDEDCKSINPNFVKSAEFCSCVCPQAVKCDAQHEFDKESCKCICNKKNYSKLEATCRSRNMRWNEDSCKCESAKPAIKIEITKS